MRKRLVKSISFLSLLTALFTFGLTGGVASAHGTIAIATAKVEQRMPRVHPNTYPISCDGRADFFGIYSDTNGVVTETCYAGRGTVYPNIANVTVVCSGNNSGTIYYYNYRTGQSGSDNLGYWWCNAYDHIYVGTLVIN